MNLRIITHILLRRLHLHIQIPRNHHNHHNHFLQSQYHHIQMNQLHCLLFLRILLLLLNVLDYSFDRLERFVEVTVAFYLRNAKKIIFLICLKDTYNNKYESTNYIWFLRLLVHTFVLKCSILKVALKIPHTSPSSQSSIEALIVHTTTKIVLIS